MTGIEWTDQTWNPTTGCDQVSPGCDNCYALTMAKRLKAMGQAKYQRDGDPRTSGPGFGLTVHPDVLEEPLRWRKPRRVFVNSMSDLFHPRVGPTFLSAVFDVMKRTPQHQYQILTKRPKRMRSFVTILGKERAFSDLWPLPNVWLGTSVEDQQRADERIPPLLDTPAAVRFLSCEPLLGPVDLTHIGDGVSRHCLPDRIKDENEGEPVCTGHGMWLPCTQGCAHIDWVIVGGESGGGARPMHENWAHSIVRQCQQASVAVFVKQMGSVWAQAHAGHKDLKGGDPQWWPESLRVREYPQEMAPA